MKSVYYISFYVIGIAIPLHSSDGNPFQLPKSSPVQKKSITLVYPGDLIGETNKFQIDKDATPGEKIEIEGNFYQVGQLADLVTDKITHAPLTIEKMRELHEIVKQSHTEETIPHACRQEIELAYRDRIDLFRLHQYNAQAFVQKTKRNLAVIKAFQNLHPEQAQLLAQNNSPKTTSALESFIKKHLELVAQQKEQAKPQPQEEMEEEEEEIIEPTTVPEVGLEQQEPEIKPEPTEEPIGPKEEKEEQEVPEKEKDIEPEQEPLGEEEEDGPSIEEPLKSTNVQEIIYILDQITENLNEFMQSSSLPTLHEHVYTSVKSAKNSLDAQAIMSLLYYELRDQLPPIHGALSSLNLEYTKAKTAREQEALQKTLNTLFAYILVCFDALMASIYDENEAITKEDTSLWSWFYTESEEQKKEKRINGLTQIKYALDNVGKLIPAFIQLCTDLIIPFMDTKDAFDQGTFNAMLYSDVKKIITIQEQTARKKGIQEELYPYDRSKIVDGQNISPANKWHKKGDSYQNIINNYIVNVTKALKDLGIDVVETAQPAEKPKEELTETKTEPQPQPQEQVEETEPKVEQTTEQPAEPAEPVTIEEKPEEQQKKVEKEPESIPEEEVIEEEPENIPAGEPAKEIEQPQDIEPEQPQTVPVTPLRPVGQQETPEQQTQKQLEAAYKNLTTYMNLVQKRPQLLIETQQAGKPILPLLFKQDLLTKFLDLFTTIMTLETNEHKKQDVSQQLNTILTTYINQLIHIINQAPIEEHTLATLHMFVHENPFDIAKIYTQLKTFFESDLVKRLKDTLEVIHSKNINLTLSESDKTLGYLCALFDAFASGIMNHDIIQKQPAETLKEKYNNTITEASNFEEIIKPWLTLFNPYFTESTRTAYQNGTLDITTIIPDLMRDDAYIYAVQANTPVIIDAVTVQTVAINALHKKEYATVLNPLRTVAESYTTLEALQKAINTEQNPTLENLTQYLADLETLKDSIDADTYTTLKNDLEAKQKALTDAQSAIDALLNTFKEEIAQARQNLDLEKPKITYIDFDKPYKKIDTLLNNHPMLKPAYEKPVAEMVTSFEVYITDALNKMIDATGLKTLHTTIQSKPQEARQAIKRALNPDAIEKFHYMLMELKQNNLFGVDSIKDFDFNNDIGQNLSKALIKGYAYILVAFDALESTLYENFSTTERIAQWVSYWWTEGKQGTETMYDKAIKILDEVMNKINQARKLYYNQLIDPFFEGPTTYKNAYNQEKLDLLLLDLENITDENNHYRYAHKGSTQVYKGESIILPAITSLHKRDYENTAAYWKRHLGRIYAPELLAQKQQDVIAAIQATNLPIPMNQLIPALKLKSDLVTQDLAQQIPEYHTIAQTLSELAQTNNITTAIQNQLQYSFKYLLGIYDGLFAYIYDLIPQLNRIKDIPAKEENEEEQEYKHQIANLITSVGEAIVDAIETFETLFSQYFSKKFKTKFKNEALLIGDDIDATVSFDPQGIKKSYIFERPSGYSANMPTKSKSESEQKHKIELYRYNDKSYATLTAGKETIKFLLPPEHRRKSSYRQFLQSWVPIINAIQQPHTINVLVQQALLENTYGETTLPNLPNLIKTDPSKAQAAITAISNTLPFAELRQILQTAPQPFPHVYQETLHETAQALIESFNATQPFIPPAQPITPPQSQSIGE